MKRTAVINFKDGSSQEIEITKAASVDVDGFVFHLDKLSDGKLRLLYSPKNITQPFAEIENITFKREE